MKKFLLLFSLTFILNINSTFAFYNDVDQNHQYYPAIKALYDLGKLPEAVSFNPDSIATKSDIYEFLFIYTETPPTKELHIPFIDVPPTHDDALYIQTALDLNLIAHHIPVFQPDKPIKKHSALSTLFNHLGIGTQKLFKPEDYSITDVNHGSFIAPTAKRAKEMGIVEPGDEHKFKPYKDITRGELAYYLYMIHNFDSTKPKTVIINQVQTPKQNTEDLEIFLDSWQTIKKDHINKDEHDYKKLQYEAIKGFIKSLNDPYTTFQEPANADEFFDTLSGEIEGIGTIIELIDNKPTIVSPLKDSPAEKAGLKANDIIVEIDNKSVENLTLKEIADLIKGKSGTTVTLKIQRDNTTKTFTISRAKIEITSVTSEIKKNSRNQNIGYIALRNFSDTTYSEFENAAKELIKQNPKGFIIDLRNNPGGFLQSSILIAGHFIDDIQTVVTLKTANGKSENYTAVGTGLLSNYKIVVLVNKGSASASEILAGALQDFNKAKIVGSQTFGKGTAQSLKNYPDGSLLKYTIANWITPKGTAIQDKGITPDHQIEDNPDTAKDEQLEKALSQF